MTRIPVFRFIAVVFALAGLAVAWMWFAWKKPEVKMAQKIAASQHQFDLALLDADARKNRSNKLFEATARPLFNPTRAPFVPAPPPTPPPMPPQITVIETPPPVIVEPPPPEVIEPLPLPPPMPVEAPKAEVELPPVIIPKIEDTGLQVKGIVFDGTQTKALLVSPTLPQGKWLKAGDEISGWRIKKIKKNEVLLMLGGTSATLQLYVDKPANQL